MGLNGNKAKLTEKLMEMEERDWEEAGVGIGPS